MVEQPIDHLVSLGLALTALGAFVVLLWERARRAAEINRFILLDMLLVVAGLELMADAVAEGIDHGAIGFLGPQALWGFAALVFRGALTAGAIGLLLTMERRGRE